MTDLLDSAYRLLGRREHSRMELERKLRKRGGAPAEIREVVEHLLERDYLSDRRFAEAFARNRVERGHGPIRIRAELRTRGVDGAIIQEVMNATDVDWAKRARDLYRRRWESPPPDADERSRRWRAMERRGFTGSQIAQAIGPASGPRTTP